ncbi:hypothetical protein BHE74_00013018 [Ensete ventricosum]|nr:hypothetical protein GW17_00019021 [Ensete ventricosum]RWW78751.1 hypothetical protein BHE74_00013018 [Ensete ventricosum]RZR91074.1 hypothetical protein BHM03_00019121 [Ensete ventricosum]
MPPRPREAAEEVEQVRVRRRALEVVLENCRRALELIENADIGPDTAAAPNSEDENEVDDALTPHREEGSPPQSQSAVDTETDEATGHDMTDFV